MKFLFLILTVLAPFVVRAGGINTYPVQGLPGVSDFALGCRTNADGSFTTELLPATALGGGAASRAIGFVTANSGRFGSGDNSGNKIWTQRKGYIAAVNITNIGVVFYNYLTSNATVRASIEYPSNVIYQLTWAGNSNGIIPVQYMTNSDLIAVTIPVGDLFWVRQWTSNSAGIQYDDESWTGEIGRAHV